MPEAKPYQISVTDAAIDQLKQKLALTRLPDELDDAGWAHGSPLADIRRLVERWKEGYDWRAHEKELNESLPQYTMDVDVDGFQRLNIHFVHKKSEREGAMPLLFVHGWPGSFIEVKKILPLLVSPRHGEASFHVVAISLPNFGFSQGVSKKGFKAAQYAEVCHKLMLSLGYNRYVTQGGDWGFSITRKMATMYAPLHLKAWHTNFPLALPPHPLWQPFSFLRFLFTPYTSEERAAVARMKELGRSGVGYIAVQSTRPQTLAYSLSDSPVGLLAWIYEKLVAWTDKYPWTDDEILTWVSVYWFSRAGPGASTRIYYEIMNSEDKLGQWPTIPVNNAPIGVSYFPKELFCPPKTWTKSLGNIVFQGSHESGGHFAAWEKPKELASDVKWMFAKDKTAFKAFHKR